MRSKPLGIGTIFFIHFVLVSEHDVAIDFEEMDRGFAAILYRVERSLRIEVALSLNPLNADCIQYTLSMMITMMVMVTLNGFNLFIGCHFTLKVVDGQK